MAPLRLWRGFLVAVVIAGAIALFAASGEAPHLGEQVARVEVDGMILDDLKRDALMRDIAEAGNVKAVILRINSPGGSTAGSEALFASIREIAEKKPVVAVLSELAASGGYVAAIAADHIVARGNTLTGSIGVILEYPNVTALMAKLGVAYETVRSSELKAEPSPFRPTNPAARAIDQAMIDDSFAWFRGLVGERRHLEEGRSTRSRPARSSPGARPWPTGWSTRSAASPRPWPGSNRARPVSRPCRCAIGKSSGRSRSSAPSSGFRRQAAGFSEKYPPGWPRSSIPSCPDSCQYGRR